MTVKEIIIDYLEKLELDGLCSCENDCWCSIDDLGIACKYGLDILDCEPGHKVGCNCGYECAYHIVPDD